MDIELRRQKFKRDYWKYHDARLGKIKERNKERLLKIKKILGSKCSICGSSEKLVFHHLRYNNGTKSQPHPSLKDLENGDLTLVCRKHHRYIAIIATLKRNNELEKIMRLVNDNTIYIS